MLYAMEKIFFGFRFRSSNPKQSWQSLAIWQWAIIQKWTLLFICNSHHHYYYLLFKFDLANYY